MWNLQKFKDKVAVIEENGNQYYYNDFITEGNNLANEIGHRCLVFSLCRNTIGSVLGYISFINGRIVPVMLNVHLEKELLNNLLKIYSPEYIWLPSDQTGCFPKMNIVCSIYDYSLLKTNFEKKYLLHENLALLLTTSGSTGSPKFVRQSYRNIESNTDSIVEYLELDNDERPITTLPMNYTYGLSIINSHFKVGATLLLTDKSVMQKEFWTFFKEYNATSFGGVPYTYEMLKKLRFMRMNLPSLKTMTQAGGKLIPDLHEEFAEFAKKTDRNFFVMYGQCEATARMSYLPANISVFKKGSIGIAIPGGSFNLVDDNGKVITCPFVNGELLYRGENVTMGYAECGNDLIKNDELNGVLYTGDLAYFDEDGYYYVTGRKKRFLKVYGNRINLDEIECMIKERFSNLECACTGTDNNLNVFVTLEKLKDEVKFYLVEKTQLNPVAFKIFAIDHLPKNESGKVLYRNLL